MINERIQNYIDNHSFCSEYLFKDWEAFLDFLYEEGGRVSSILWWEHCKKNFLPIQMMGNGCILRPGFMKMDLKKNPLQI